MNVTEFDDLLDRYGGHLSSWPAALRADAEALLATSAPARASLRAVGEFETFLRDTAMSVETPAADAMAARAMRHRQIRGMPVVARRAAWATAAAAALVLGIFVGDVRPPREDGPAHVMAAAFDPMGTFDVD